MTPQSSFMVLAPIDPRREAELRRLLASMNDAPGRVKPGQRADPVRAVRYACTSRGCSSWTTRRSTTSASTACPAAPIRCTSRFSAMSTAMPTPFSTSW